MTPVPSSQHQPAATSVRVRQAIPCLVLAAAAVAGATSLSPRTWLVWLTDGLYVAALLLAALGWGAWPAGWLGFRKPSFLALALGLGLLACGTLVLGVCGLLGAYPAWILLATGGLLGAWRWREIPPAQPTSNRLDPPPWRDIAWKSLVLLPLALPLGILLFGATLPPGILWAGEAHGYDVLEYHLQVPREYYDAGRIIFLPHNVYAAFPQGIESLYLLLMCLQGGPHAAALSAQLLHAALAVLAAATLARAASPGWPRYLVTLAVGSVPWLAYIGCLAYVEAGLLFFAAVAGTLLLKLFTEAEHVRGRMALAAGLAAGLAGGCKYTALAFVVVAAGLAAFATQPGRLSLRCRRLACYALGAFVAFSPWLLRNAAFTGNPLYPFAYEWLDGRGWSDQQAAQWRAGHRLPTEQAGLSNRLQLAHAELFGSGMFGMGIWILALAAALARRNRLAAFALIWTLVLLAMWAAWTRMPGRFALPLVVPLGLLVGGFTPPRRHPLLAAGLLVLGSAAGLAGGLKLRGLLAREDAWWRRTTGQTLADMVDRTDLLIQSNPINRAVPEPDALVWILGESRLFYVRPHARYTVTFCRDPWLEFAARGASPADCVAWLRTQNVTHVVFSWPEITRLRETYGFSPLVTPAWTRALASAGLRRIAPASGEPAAVDIYEVTPE